MKKLFHILLLAVVIALNTMACCCDCATYPTSIYVQLELKDFATREKLSLDEIEKLTFEDSSAKDTGMRGLYHSEILSTGNVDLWFDMGSYNSEKQRNEVEAKYKENLKNLGFSIKDSSGKYATYTMSPLTEDYKIITDAFKEDETLHIAYEIFLKQN